MILFPRKNQSWSITSQQKECISNTIRERVTYITDDSITVIDNLGMDSQ